MKKLSVLLLATVFVFGLVVQAGAQEQRPHVVSKDALAGDPVITFDEFAAPYDPATHPDGYDCWADPKIPPALISAQYEPEFGVSLSGDGVSFSEGLYGENSFSVSFISELAATNFNFCMFFNELDIPGKPVMVSFDKPVTRVGFIGFSPDGGITFTPFRGGVATADPISFNTPLFFETFIGIEDSDGIDAIIIESEGDANLYGRENLFWIDDFTFGGTPETGSTEVEVTMNVNPPSCSGSSLNMKSKGVTPVVIAGSADFDVTMIDPDSIQLHGVAPVRSAIEDVPYCNKDRDGYMDLTLKFDTQELVDAVTASLGDGETLENDDWPVLHLTGSLFDGTAIYADEPVSVKGKPREENNRKGKKH